MSGERGMHEEDTLVGCGFASPRASAQTSRRAVRALSPHEERHADEMRACARLYFHGCHRLDEVVTCVAYHAESGRLSGQYRVGVDAMDL